MKIHTLLTLMVSLSIASCKNNDQSESAVPDSPYFENLGHELVYAMVQQVGDYYDLSQKKNVTYIYVYRTPDGQVDSSIEQYIFDGELSYGQYLKHERTLSHLEGVIEQGYDGNEYWLKQNGVLNTDTTALKRVAFNRPTNFYWFAMMQKLLDPGLSYEHLGEKSIDDQMYDIVKVTFPSEDDKLTDIYQLYINQKTTLVDQFLFTVADFNKMEEPYLMQVKYEEVEGILLPTIRQYKKSTWNAEINDSPWVHVSWKDIRFNTNISKADFEK